MKFYRITIFAITLSVGLALGARQVQQKTTERYDYTRGMSDSRVGGGVQDNEGLLWFASWNGLNCYDGYDFHWVKIRPGDSTPIRTDRIRDILLSTKRSIFCRTDDGIYEFSLDTYTFNDISDTQRDSLTPLMGRPWRGLTDAQGNLWWADRSGKII